MRIGLVGYGVVGRALGRFFGRNNDIVIFDKFLDAFNSADQRIAINQCDLAFLAVPTPSSSDGYSADLSALRDAVAWITAPICIRSTVPPGTTENLVVETGKLLAFSPVYIGESPNHPWIEEDRCGYVIVGGEAAMVDLVFSAYRTVARSGLQYVQTDPTSAELCKYMENCFLATKVAFVNEFWDIAQQVGVDYEELRSLWLLDPRIGPSHSAVTPERGFGGRCLPKDVRAIISVMQSRGGAPFLEAVLSFNEAIRAKAQTHP